MLIAHLPGEEYRGLTDHGSPQDGGVSLRTSSTVFNRMMPYWSENDRRRDAPADATQRLYHLSAPLRLSRNGRPSLSPDGSEEPLTRDVQEVLTSLQDLASHPRLRCLLYGNKVLQHYGRQENNGGETSMIFEKNSLTYKQVPRGDLEGKGLTRRF